MSVVTPKTVLSAALRPRLSLYWGIVRATREDENLPGGGLPPGVFGATTRILATSPLSDDHSAGVARLKLAKSRGSLVFGN